MENLEKVFVSIHKGDCYKSIKTIRKAKKKWKSFAKCNIYADDKEYVSEIVNHYVLESEKQGFINGFLFATQLWKESEKE